MIKIRCGIAALAFLFGAADATAQQTVEIRPHSAVYSLSLLEASVGEVSSIDGSLEATLTRTCDEWISALDMAMYARAGGAQMFELTGVSTYREALDGTRFEFEAENRLNGEDVGSSAGTAVMTPGEGGIVTYTVPEGVSFDLPATTEFPYASVRDMVQAFWVDGERIRTYFYFDGGEDGVLRATDLVAGAPEPVPDGIEDPDGLLTGEPLRIVTTFFSPEGGDNTPVGTVIGDMLPTGVLTRMTIEVGFMTIVAHLRAVDANQAPVC